MIVGHDSRVLSQRPISAMLMFRPLMRYADFRGRSSRTEYFLFMTLQVVALGLCVGLAVNALSGLGRDTANAVMGLLVALAAAGLLMAVCALPNYAVLSRRLHDSNKSALWMALLLPDILALMVVFLSAGQVVRLSMSGMAQPEMIEAAMSAAGGSLLVNILAILCRLALFIMTLLPGTRGPNRFGPDPRDPEGIAGQAQGQLAGQISGQISGQDQGRYSEERLDALIAEAKRNQAMTAAAPSSGDSYPSANRGWPDTGFSAEAAPARPFGRRGA